MKKTVVCASVIAAVVFAIWIGVPLLFRSDAVENAECGPQRQRIRSPDGTKELLVTDYGSYLKLCPQKTTAYIEPIGQDDHRVLAFEVLRSYIVRDDMPSYAWSSNDTLTITINDIAPITISQHAAGGINIVYHAGEKVLKRINDANKFVHESGGVDNAVSRLKFSLGISRWMKSNVP